MRIIYVIFFLTVVFLALAWPDAQAKQPRDLERIADALERLANCGCLQVCDRWHCDASSSSSNGGELP